MGCFINTGESLFFYSSMLIFFVAQRRKGAERFALIAIITISEIVKFIGSSNIFMGVLYKIL
jgi:hypothetical protein